MENQQEHFILDKILFGTKLKIHYQAWNENMNDYRDHMINEKEDWHNDFKDVIRDITLVAARKVYVDVENDGIRNIRLKKIAFEGLMCKGELIVYTYGKLEPFKIQTYAFNLDSELKRHVIEEAEAYIYRDKRNMGDMFSMGAAVINDPEDPELEEQTEEELAL